MPRPEVYARLLAVYLYEEDLCSAKFLWKRIPETVKNDGGDGEELASLWDIGRALWTRDLPAVYAAIDARQWSSNVTAIVTAIKGIYYTNPGFILCAPFLSKMENGHLFSSSLPRFDKCHETSRIFPRTEQTFASHVPGVLVSFLDLRFLEEMALLILVIAKDHFLLTSMNYLVLFLRDLL